MIEASIFCDPSLALDQDGDFSPAIASSYHYLCTETKSVDSRYRNYSPNIQMMIEIRRRKFQMGSAPNDDQLLIIFASFLEDLHRTTDNYRIFAIKGFLKDCYRHVRLILMDRDAD